MLYAIDAKERIHKGSDGIRTLIVDDFKDVKEADEHGWKASRDLIESSRCLDYLKDDIYDIADDYDHDELLERAILDDIYFKVYRIKDEYQKQLPKDLEGLFKMDPYKFIEEYCEGEYNTKALRVFDRFFS